MIRLILLVMLGCLAGCGPGGGVLAQSTNPTGRVGPPTGLPPPSGAQTFPLQGGPATSIGGGGGAQTLIVPGGGIATAVPNGNGTTTVTHTDGRVEVINTPR